jgi:hypothetical protein
MLRPAHLLPPKRLSTPHPARHHSTTNRSLLPGTPVPTKTGPTPANSIQLPGHDILLFLQHTTDNYPPLNLQQPAAPHVSDPGAPVSIL